MLLPQRQLGNLSAKGTLLPQALSSEAGDSTSAVGVSTKNLGGLWLAYHSF